MRNGPHFPAPRHQFSAPETSTTRLRDSWWRIRSGVDSPVLLLVGYIDSLYQERKADVHASEVKRQRFDIMNSMRKDGPTFRGGFWGKKPETGGERGTRGAARIRRLRLLLGLSA